MYDLGWLWMAWMFIIRNSIGCGQCLRPKMLSDIFCFSFTLLLPNWLLISIRIYSGIARFPCDSMAFLYLHAVVCSAVACIVVYLHQHPITNVKWSTDGESHWQQSEPRECDWYEQAAVIRRRRKSMEKPKIWPPPTTPKALNRQSQKFDRGYCIPHPIQN